MQNGADGLPSIVLAGHGILVKMLITLEPHVIFFFIKLCILIHYNIIEMQLFKTAIKLFVQSLLTVLHTWVSVMINVGLLDSTFVRDQFQKSYVETLSLATRTFLSIIIPRVSF